MIFTSRDGSPYNPNYFCIMYKILLSSQSSSGAFGAPDYNRVYYVKATNIDIWSDHFYEIIVPDNGYVIVDLYGGDYSPGDGSGSPATELTINGVSPARLFGGNYLEETVTIPVAKGDIIRGTSSVYFVPCK